MTFREAVNAHCAALPGAVLEDPWGGGHDAWKVGGKMFACFGAVEPGVSVTTPDIETAAMLIDTGTAVRAPYFHRSWVRFLPEAAMDEVVYRVDASYDIVRSGLTRKVQAALPERAR